MDINQDFSSLEAASLFVIDAHPWKLRCAGWYDADDEDVVGVDADGGIMTRAPRVLLHVQHSGSFENVLTGEYGDLPEGHYALTDDGLFRVAAAKAA